MISRSGESASPMRRYALRLGSKIGGSCTIDGAIARKHAKAKTEGNLGVGGASRIAWSRNRAEGDANGGGTGGGRERGGTPKEGGGRRYTHRSDKVGIARHRVVAKRTRVGAEGKRKRSEREAQGRCGAARAPPPHVHTRARARMCARARAYIHTMLQHRRLHSGRLGSARARCSIDCECARVCTCMCGQCARGCQRRRNSPLLWRRYYVIRVRASEKQKKREPLFSES